jgi:purine nucleosidase
MARPFLIDTDTASDDAVALIMALRDPAVDVKAITVVAGNVPAEHGARNAAYVVELCGRDTPVYVGADRPLVRAYEHAEWFHGRDGLGDMNYPAARVGPVQDEHAVDAIVRVARQTPGLTLVTLGPLTNVSLALRKAPDIAPNVSRVVVMGGNPACEGNVTPAAEYNIWVDPEAARIVFRAPWPVEMVGWHLCRGPAVVDPDEIRQLRAMDTPLARFAVDCNRVAMAAYRRQCGEDGISLPDPTAMAIALDPTIATDARDHYVEVATEGDLTRGMTVVDKLNVVGDDRNGSAWAEAHKAKIVWTLDVQRFKQLLRRSLK